MNSDQPLSPLSDSEKFLFAGHIATAIGFLLISVGTSLRLLETGKLPGGFPFNSQLPSNDSRGRDENYARNYFS